ncbi:DUF541 domain-containing protein [Candidatus Pacearchaeota archaeon]|nr:DUF541 domain-containing protein [Candidatus Pacearchaeota archaeon]
MNSSYTITGLVIAIFALGGYLFLGGASGPTVSAVGEVELSALPDEVVIYVAVEGRDKTAQVAQTQMRTISDAVATALRAQGVDDSVIQVQSEQIYQDYSWETGRQVLKGFVASQTIIVRTTETRSVASLVDSVVGAGGLVQSINFELSDAHAASVKADALTAAGKDAERKATALALGVGKGLGSLVSIMNEDYSYVPMVYYARAEGASDSDAKLAAASLTPRDVSVSARVAVTYRVSRW